MWDELDKLTDKWIAEARAISVKADATFEDIAKAKTLLECADEVNNIMMLEQACRSVRS